MKLFNLEIIYQGGTYEDAVLVKSFDEYKSKGGERDVLDVYYHIKTRAKNHESKYIQLMDMSLSGIPVKDVDIAKQRAIAQIYWLIINMWFDKPLRKVSYSNFYLPEFEKL